jgi:hypothetical protein
VLFSVLLCGVERFCRSVKWLTSPWYLPMFGFTKSSMPYLLSSTSSSNLKMKWITLIWERHKKRKVVKEKDNEKRMWKGDLEKEKGNERKNITQEKCDKGRAWKSKREMEGAREMKRREVNEREIQPALLFWLRVSSNFWMKLFSIQIWIKDTSTWCQHDILYQVDFLLRKRWIFNEDDIQKLDEIFLFLEKYHAF